MLYGLQISLSVLLPPKMHLYIRRVFIIFQESHLGAVRYELATLVHFDNQIALYIECGVAQTGVMATREQGQVGECIDIIRIGSIRQIVYHAAEDVIEVRSYKAATLSYTINDFFHGSNKLVVGLVTMNSFQ